MCALHIVYELGGHIEATSKHAAIHVGQIIDAALDAAEAAGLITRSRAFVIFEAEELDLAFLDWEL